MHGGRNADTFNRFGALVGATGDGRNALREALLAPFDGELLACLDPRFAIGLADAVLVTLGGGALADEVPLIDWLLECVRTVPDALPSHLRYRLAETLLFRQQFDAARSLVAPLETPESQALGAAIDTAEGRFADGAAGFEAALKALAAETGKRRTCCRRRSPGSTRWRCWRSLTRPLGSRRANSPPPKPASAMPSPTPSGASGSRRSTSVWAMRPATVTSCSRA
jgi:hypothetical protein